MGGRQTAGPRNGENSKGLRNGNARFIGGNEHGKGSPRLAMRPHATKLDCAVELLDDAAADPQSESRPFVGLRGEERLKNLVPMLHGNADSGVRDADLNPPARRPLLPLGMTAEADSKRSSIRHRLKSIRN